jgi:hypothetical protein
MTHKSFEERLADLINDELTFPRNPIVASESVISALELQLVKQREELEEFKKDV